MFRDASPRGGEPEAVVRRMTDALAHRGPDGEGVTVCLTPGREPGRGPSVALGHRRLAIIDLSPRAAQPMAAAEAPVWLTFNGEIYNFKALRAELEQSGHRFRSDSDTEVILQGYLQWGTRVVDRLRGMFAFAIWDGRTDRVFVARDRFGIKPLYMYETGEALLFASEVRSLLASGLVPRRLDLVALDRYLAMQTVSPPRTMVEGVRLLEPGCCAISERGSHPVVRRYWDLLDRAAPDAKRAAPAEAREHVRNLLAESAALHLVSDVPVGVFLSGGIDSGAITALVRRTGVVPRTFCVSFPGTSYDEGPVAKQVAAALGAEHTEIPLAEADFRRQLPDALDSVDHPSGDGMNTFVVCRAVRAAGIKVALSGLGGDELFGGYPSFARLRRIASYARMWRWSPPRVRRAAALAVRTFGGSSVRATRVAALVGTDASLPHAYPLMRQLFDARQRAALIGTEAVERAARADDAVEALLSGAVARHPEAEPMAGVSYAEARTYMHDVLLRDTDHMSMAHGLEVRVPFLDHHLGEYVIGLADAVRLPDGRPKGLLTDTLEGILPPELARLPKKGFVLPFDPWMRGDLRALCEHHLGPAGLAGRPEFRGHGVGTVWQSFLAREGNVTWGRPWALVALNAWLEQTGVAA